MEHQFYYQIFKVIGHDEDGEVLDYENPYKGLEFNNQYEAQRVIEEEHLDGWRASDIEIWWGD